MGNAECGLRIAEFGMRNGDVIRYLLYVTRDQESGVRNQVPSDQRITYNGFSLLSPLHALRFLLRKAQQAREQDKPEIRKEYPLKKGTLKAFFNQIKSLIILPEREN